MLMKVRAVYTKGLVFVYNYKDVDFFFFSFPLPLERKCSHPGELQHGFVKVADLTFGSKATFSCEPG